MPNFWRVNILYIDHDMMVVIQLNDKLPKPLKPYATNSKFYCKLITHFSKLDLK